MERKKEKYIYRERGRDRQSQREERVRGKQGENEKRLGNIKETHTEKVRR